jgi:hypothetical protein
MNDIPFVTTETSLAAYLIISGFTLLKIQYEPRSNGKQRGIFIFQNAPDIEGFKDRFENGQPSYNYPKFNEVKSGLLDRIMKGLP